MNVYVTNRSNTELSVGYDGVLYEFKKNVPVCIPMEGAVRLFGYRQEDREHILVRYGWIKLHSELEEGLKLLDKFEITVDMQTKDSALPSAVGIVPLRLERGVGGKSLEKRVA
jgi:hypothetical protein